MNKPTKVIGEIRNYTLTKSVRDEALEKMLTTLIENESDESRDRINHIRLLFVHFTKVTEHIYKQMRGLTGKLLHPNEEEMYTIRIMIAHSRDLYRSSGNLVDDYEILWKNVFITLEMNDFQIAIRRLREAVYYVESVYLGSAAAIGINEPVRGN